jgi:RNA polymerase sigma-70 factor (ECF subfamily)
LRAAVQALPEHQRETLMLFYFDELSYRDLAELLNVSTATVNARLTEARATLRRKLGALTR